jgi:spore germination protein KC
MLKIFKAIFLLVICLVLSGCWDQRQIEKRAYVYAIGMDKAEEENKFTITYLIINPEFGTMATGGGNANNPHEIISFETNDLITSRNLANAVIAKEITYDLLRAIVVSEELAQEKQFIRWMYDATKDREIRRDNFFIVTKEKASKFFEKNEPKLETRINKYFEYILNRGIETGMIPESDLHRYFKITEADASLFLSIYGTTQKSPKQVHTSSEDQLLAGQLETKGKTNPTQFLGSAVFKEGRMIGKLSAEETRAAVLLNDTLEMSDFLTTYPDPFDNRYLVAARIIKKSDNDVKMKLKNGTGFIDVTIPLHVEVLSDHSMVDYSKSKAKRQKLKQTIKSSIESKLEALVKKTQEEFKGEPFGWSLLARKKFSTINQYEKFDWMKSYPNIKVNVKVSIVFGEFGRQTELPKYERVRD